ncbi:MAG: helix-turn-helix domain-containing protein [Synergistaceae bacterium]|nr:helix-turn-helix domain-containing protein [Synergistaceae bacterium]
MTPNKTALLTRINSLRKELDELADLVILLEETQPVALPPNVVEQDKFLTVKQVCELLQISDSTFYEHLRSGLLPPGISFGARSKRWRMSDIRAWQEGRNNTASVKVIVSEGVKKRRGRPLKVRREEEFYA